MKYGFWRQDYLAEFDQKIIMKYWSFSFGRILILCDTFRDLVKGIEYAVWRFLKMTKMIYYKKGIRLWPISPHKKLIFTNTQNLPQDTVYSLEVHNLLN